MILGRRFLSDLGDLFPKYGELKNEPQNLPNHREFEVCDLENFWKGNKN